jgi:hypothetical protein
MVFGAIVFHLDVGGNPNPDADVFSRFHCDRFVTKAAKNILPS